MLPRMIRRLAPFVVAAAVLAVAVPARAETPVVGQPWLWPTLKDWLEATPSGSDTAGKVVVHWFCRAKVEGCKDDLARIYNLREQGNVYVIAYVDGSKRDALKLDPVRGDVGAGAVAFGKPVAKLCKALGVSPAKMPMSIIVDVDGKVAAVTYTSDPDQLDLRDATVAKLVERIKIFTVATTGPTAAVKKGESFTLALTTDLAAWLDFDTSVQPELKLTLPPDVTCDAQVLKAAQIKVTGKQLSAAVTCKGTVKGSYEAGGALRFSYRSANKAVGVGEDAVRWKFSIAP